VTSHTCTVEPEPQSTSHELSNNQQLGPRPVAMQAPVVVDAIEMDLPAKSATDPQWVICVCSLCTVFDV